MHATDHPPKVWPKDPHVGSLSCHQGTEIAIMNGLLSERNSKVCDLAQTLHLAACHLAILLYRLLSVSLHYVLIALDLVLLEG